MNNRAVRLRIYLYANHSISPNLKKKIRFRVTHKLESRNLQEQKLVSNCIHANLMKKETQITRAMECSECF